MRRAQANQLVAAQRRVETYEAKEAERAEQKAAAKQPDTSASKRTAPQSFSRRRKAEHIPTPEADLPSLKTGDRVEHAKFGKGMVVSVEGEGESLTYIVAFPNQGVKRLSAAFAKLEKV
jgi:DNA helicase-2/ATP-dependent DNA helicase PcrA